MRKPRVNSDAYLEKEWRVASHGGESFRNELVFLPRVWFRFGPKNRGRAIFFGYGSGSPFGPSHTCDLHDAWLIICSKFEVLADTSFSDFRFNKESSIITTSTGISHITLYSRVAGISPSYIERFCAGWHRQMSRGGMVGGYRGDR